MKGKIVQVSGPVVDVEFELDNMEVIWYNTYKNKQKLIPDMSYKRKVLL